MMRIIFLLLMGLCNLSYGQSEKPWALEFNASLYNSSSSIEIPRRLILELRTSREFYSSKRVILALGAGYSRSFNSHEAFELYLVSHVKLGMKEDGLRVDIGVPLLYNRFSSSFQTLNKIDAEIGVGYKWYLNGRLYAYPMVGVLFLKDKGSSFPYDAFDPHTVVRPNFKLGIGYRFGKKDKQE